MRKVKLIDLSTPLQNYSFEPRPAQITYIDHEDWVGQTCRLIDGLQPSDIPNGRANAMDFVQLSTHTATHLDAPLHYSPNIEGKPAKSVDEIPLEWLYGDGVVLDFRHLKAGEFIYIEHIQEALAKINYEIKSWDIVLIMTGVSARRNDTQYPNLHPGMSKEATIWLIDKGVKVMGIDAFNFDVPFKYQSEELKKGNKDVVFATHYGMASEKEYIHIEQMANLDKIPQPHGFKIACFPINILKATGGWVRPVAIIE